MTTPTTQPLTPAQQAAEQFREEIRAAFDLIHVEIAELRADLAQMREGLTHASQPAPTVGTGNTFTAVKIEREKRKGKYYYKMIGGQFSKHGITVWDEILEAMNLDKVEYDTEDIHKLNPPIEVRFSSELYTDEEGTKNRRKVIGKA
jgi:hypothetical protein